MNGRWHSRFTLLSGLLSSLCFVAPAAAQDPFFGPDMGGGMGGPGGGMGGSQAPAKKKGADKAPPPGTPEMHAASGASDTLAAPGSEPSLPAQPLKISAATQARIGSDHILNDLERGRSGEVDRDFYGLYYGEQSGSYSLKTLFPLWLERSQPSLTDPSKADRASLFAGVYYNRRSAEHTDDVLFPVFWNLMDKTSRTTVVGPLVNRVAPNENHNWLAPLYFIGHKNDSNYTILPPLLTYFNQDKDSGFNLIGPGFCKFEGTDHCSAGLATDIDQGIVPFFFYGHDETSQYRLIPPLLHYHSEDEKDLSWTNIWGPAYRHHGEERDAFHLLPLYFSLWGNEERHTTVLPLFHYGYKGASNLLVTPLFLNRTGDQGEKTFITWGYARHRGRTELDMWTPLYWQYRDPDIDLEQHLLFPFFYRLTSPRESSWAVFPLGGHFERFGISETTWITPLFRHSHDLRGWSTSINPLFHFGRDGNDSHTVIAPFFWDFSGPSYRTTIGAPLYWRFSRTDTVSQLIANVYYREKRVKHGLDWELHLFPFLSYGETPDGHWWNFLYGLAGYTREGSMSKVRTFWVPIKLSE